MIYLQLFLAFLSIGAFSFGGGYAAMPLIQQQVINTYHWLNLAEFTDLVTISQMTPGPIAINAATFVGIRVAGIPGAIIATIGCILPSCIIVTIIAFLYVKYRHLAFIQNVLKVLKPVVVSLIAVAGLSILMSAFFKNTVSINTIQYQMIIIFVICLFLLRYKKMDPVMVMFLAGVFNLIYVIIM